MGPKAIQFIQAVARKLLSKRGKGIASIGNRMQAEAKAGEIAETFRLSGIPLQKLDDFIKSENDVVKYLNLIESSKPKVKQSIQPKPLMQSKSGDVIDFPPERITDWTKARPQPPVIEEINGIKTTRGIGDLFARQMKNVGKETDAQIIARIKKQNKEAAERLRNKKDPDEPEGFYQGGRAGYVEGGPIYPRLGELSSGVSSAEEQLQQINQSLQTAETNLGESGPGGAGSVTPSVNGYESSGSSLYNESPAGEVTNPYQAPVGMDPFDNSKITNLNQLPIGQPQPKVDNPYVSDQYTPGNSSEPLQQTADPARQAYDKEVEGAKKQRAEGFMGRVVLPGEMSFENFLSGYNFNQNNPSSLVQSPGIGGGLGGLQPQLIDTAPEFKKSSDPIMGGFQGSDIYKNMMGRPMTTDSQNYILDGKEMSGSGTYFGGLRKYLESIGKGGLLQQNNNAYGNAGPLQSLSSYAPGVDPMGSRKEPGGPLQQLAQGGRVGLYQGGQAKIEPDLSGIGHGSNALMSRNMQLSPGSQATTSTGLNYLLGEDNDTTRVPYNEGNTVLPKPKPMNEYLLEQVMSQAGVNTLDPRTRQMFIEELKKKLEMKIQKQTEAGQDLPWASVRS